MSVSRSSAPPPRPWWQRLRNWTFGLYLLAASIATGADALVFLVLYLIQPEAAYAKFGPLRVDRELVAISVSYPFGVWVQYLLTKAFVFVPGERAFAPGQLSRYIQVAFLVFVLNDIVTRALLHLAPGIWWGTPDGLAFWSRLAASTAVGGFSYFAHRMYTFRVGQDQDAMS